MTKSTTDGHMDRVIAYLHQIAVEQGVSMPANETDSLFEAGVLDSFGLLDFVVFLENEINLQIPDEDLMAGNFDTIARIKAYIGERLGA